MTTLSNFPIDNYIVIVGRQKEDDIKIDPWDINSDEDDNKLTEQVLGVADKGLEDWDQPTPKKTDLNNNRYT